MFDLYGLPRDFPGQKESRRLTDPYQKAAILEKELAQDIEDNRFTPYIQLHEFETLIFPDLRFLSQNCPVMCYIILRKTG